MKRFLLFSSMILLIALLAACGGGEADAASGTAGARVAC